jgi:hypothetical protein
MFRSGSLPRFGENSFNVNRTEESAGKDEPEHDFGNLVRES